MAGDPAPDSPRHILVVDDDRDICAAVSLLLRSKGYEVAVAAGGKEALKTVETFLPDLVLLDIMMPGMDGFAVYQAISTKLGQRIPFLFITATALRVGEEWLRGVPHATMHKPLDFDDLLTCVRRLLKAPRP